MWGRQMARLQPLVAELKERYKDKKTGQMRDPQEFNQKVMGLYKEYGLNPMSYFILIYQCMLQYRFEFQNGTFLWIGSSLSSGVGGFVAPNLGERDYMLIILYAISMVVTTLLTPVSDPSNVKQQRFIGVTVAVVFSVSMFFYPLPSAFVLYWVFTNVFATIQMLRAYKLPLPPLVKVNAAGGGVYPTEPQLKPNGQAGTKGVPVKHKPKKKK
jgi:YidC/Oxa1 family membrane protein insertase